MPTNSNALSSVLHDHIAIGRSPEIPDEMTMRKFRVVFEDEKTGQEFAGFSGISRKRAEEIMTLIRLKGDHDLQTGRLPARKSPARPAGLPVRRKGP